MLLFFQFWKWLGKCTSTVTERQDLRVGPDHGKSTLVNSSKCWSFEPFWKMSLIINKNVKATESPVYKPFQRHLRH